MKFLQLRQWILATVAMFGLFVDATSAAPTKTVGKTTRRQQSTVASTPVPPRETESKLIEPEPEYEGEQVSHDEVIYEPIPIEEAFGEMPVRRYCASAPINMLGHLDAQNRLNVFNNHSAQPITHAWYGFAFAANYSVGEIQDGAALGLTQESGELPNQVRNRVGFELAISRNFSVSFQGEHINVTDAEILADHWVNPQVMLKRVFYRDTRNIISGVVGVNFEGDVQPQESRENSSSVNPGLLWYHTCGECFFHAGFQFGLPTGSTGIDTLSYTVGYGRFLYRDPCQARYSKLYGGYGAGRSTPCCDGDSCDSCGADACRGGFFGWLRREVGLPIHTVTWQIEGYGKGILGEGQYTLPVGDSDLLNTPSLTINEQEDTFDLTAGGTVLYGKGWGANAAVSTPVAGDEVYSVAFLTSVWKNF
jgi:hypothetical protein